MSHTNQSWFQANSEYFSGALFGLITLDLFMLLMHGLVEQSIEGYGLGTLGITVPIMLVWVFEKLYSNQDH